MITGFIEFTEEDYLGENRPYKFALRTEENALPKYVGVPTQAPNRRVKREWTRPLMGSASIK
jgi:hypothetical protein